MGFKQFNLTYLQHDDRIIFRFNTTDNCEYKFWLTRRIAHRLLTLTGQLLAKDHKQNTPSVENVISEAQSDSQGLEFNKTYQPGAKYPIGADAILVIDIKVEMIKAEDQDLFSLDFILPGGGNMNLKLPVRIIKNLILLLEELNLNAKWGNPMSTA